MIKGYMSHLVCLGGGVYTNHIVYTDTEGIISEPEPFLQEKEGIRFYEGIITVLSADAEPVKEKIKAELCFALSENHGKDPARIIINHPLYMQFKAEPGKRAVIIEI